MEVDEKEVNERVDILDYKLDRIISLLELGISLKSKIDIEELKNYITVTVDPKEAIAKWREIKYGTISPHVLSLERNQDERSMVEQLEKDIRDLRKENSNYINKFKKKT
ncbi:hypothetical protein A2215_01520 [Candidatus Berkelbacteria bacterium RIFOXYA2_FULL_43_10]|uniref:Uncharacterized protein n=1 Tax=Candidatus Berkelbacteria bacterium RIFOXYA2_FULL_43_10 TaxID=1797472 RepID=A0A1F5E6U1_9BACT|nr:MAG: hypothetical protein A2215_01520 [Candidatus Berkelbacteria bacterium RIFOXYA2_FULL_43_10]